MGPKKSGKALLKEEGKHCYLRQENEPTILTSSGIGLERTDNNMDVTSWPVIPAINQKNYYTEYLKRDDQILAYRLQQEENRNRMTKQARDRDRALAQGRPVGPDGDLEMEDDPDEAQDEAVKGTKTIVIHVGSQNMRIGLAADALPKSVPMVIAKRSTKSESEEDGGEPRPKRIKLDDSSEPEPEKQFGDEVSPKAINPSTNQSILFTDKEGSMAAKHQRTQFARRFSAMSNELKVRMRMNKRRVLPQSRDMVLSYNKRNPPETISEHNDPLRIDWTELSADPKQAPECITGTKALRIPDNSRPRYKLHWPIRHGWVNERDYQSKHFLWSDVARIIRDAINENLGLPIRTRREWSQYSCVFVIPDLYDRKYVTSLLSMGLGEFGLGRVCFFQESLAASFGAGFSTACIVDIGAQKTSISCVEEGMCIENSRVNLKMGGQDITETFVKMLLYNHFPYSEINLNRRYDFLLAEELKQRDCTMQEADIAVHLHDFHLRVAGQDTRKYTYKSYDEVVLAPMGLFKPVIFDNDHKLDRRHKLIDRSRDIYDGSPNEPTSNAQTTIYTSIAPHLATVALPTSKNAMGGSSSNNANANVNNHNINNGQAHAEAENEEKAKPTDPANRRLNESDYTPRSTPAGSPLRELEATPQPNGTPTAGHEHGDKVDGSLSQQQRSQSQSYQQPPTANPPPPPPPPAPAPAEQAEEEEKEKPLPISQHREDIVPAYPLPLAILTSILHASGLITTTNINNAANNDTTTTTITSTPSSSSGNPHPKIRDYLGGIMLVGGTSLIPGLATHLEGALQAALMKPSDLGTILDGSTTSTTTSTSTTAATTTSSTPANMAAALSPHVKDIMIGRPPRELDAQVVAWKGGSVFGRMGKTNDSWVGGVEYERLGERVLVSKCMWAW